MNKNRHAERLPWVSTGVLEVDGVKHECFLDNISDEGALIRFCETGAPLLSPGVVCMLKVILLNVVEYPCQVVHVHSPQVGLKFLEK